MSDHQDIATAPGDLPPAEIVQRMRSVREQLRHENTTEPLLPAPGESVRVTAVAGAAVSLATVSILYTTDGSPPDSAASAATSAVRMHLDGVEWVSFGGYCARWTGTIPGQAEGTVVRYAIVGTTPSGGRVDAQDGQGFWYRYPAGSSVTVFAYRVCAERPEPEWLSRAVIYQVFVDRFRRPGGLLNTHDLQAKHGGELAGIQEALPYLRELGVNCLWLSPLGPAPSYHRYDATDYFSVDPLLGDTEALKALTGAAHRLGMRVILDFVPSHFSREHPAFQNAIADPEAETRDWFVFYEWPHEYRSFLDTVPSLVSLNTASPGARDYLIRSARFWMECGVDGFRLDHVIGHGMDFWVEFQRALERTNPQVVTIGEATDTGDALRRYQGRMDAVLDFPLARALRLTFATGDWSVRELDNFLDLYDRYMTPGPARVGFLDNHDMDRFLLVAGHDRSSLKLAALCMLTLRQTPVLYYGTEVGMTHRVSTSDRGRGGDALARQDMIWDESLWDADLLEWFRALIRLRGSAIDAILASRERLHVDADQMTWAYALGRREYAVVFNLARAARTVPRVVSGELLLTTGESVGLNEEGLVVPARTGAVLRLT